MSDHVTNLTILKVNGYRIVNPLSHNLNWMAAKMNFTNSVYSFQNEDLKGLCSLGKLM